jgi:hypothetical protein
VLRCADEIDAIGTKRYDSHSGGEREIQRTMLELLNQMDGFDALSEVKVGVLVVLREDSMHPGQVTPSWACVCQGSVLYHVLAQLAKLWCTCLGCISSKYKHSPTFSPLAAVPGFCFVSDCHGRQLQWIL